jgi:stage II sporulation protein D
MGTFNRSTRLRRTLTLAAVITVSGCPESLLLNSRALIAQAAAAQKADWKKLDSNKSDSKQSGSKKADAQDADSPAGSRPRRVAIDKQSDEPIIRIGLMTDVSFVTLSSASGLAVRRSNAGSRDDQKLAASQLRVEARRQAEARKAVEVIKPAEKKKPPAEAQNVYAVWVGSNADQPRARKLYDVLKKEFSEPTAMSYDSAHKEYDVLVGRFKTRGQAEEMVKRMRKAGYTGSRVVSDQKPAERRDNADASARVAGQKTEPRFTERPARTSRKPDAPHANEMAAFDASRLLATSTDRIIVSPASQIDDEASRKKPPSVRVGNKEYRGEIHLVLNEHGRINVVNALPVEDYLRGVVPLEMPVGANPRMEALKAQAVAARSYALARRGQFQSAGFDIRDDARSQVYGGLSAEHPISNLAVEQTRGMVAVYYDEDGHAVPIEALYTSTCGGRTENNEAVFGGKPIPYLRSVTCAADRLSLSGHDIISNAATEQIVGADGRSLAREVALLQALGVSLPRRVNAQYLGGAADQTDVRRWIEDTARAARTEKPARVPGDITRFATFAQAVAGAVYGEGRVGALLPPADVDYILAGLGCEDLPREIRADLAMLLRDGIVRLPTAQAVRDRSQVTRGYAIETLARALYKSQISNLKSQVAGPAENGRLIIASKTAAPSRRPISAEVNDKGEHDKSERRDGLDNGLEVERGAWLFRRLGDESYAVNRLTLIGGERVSYHVNAAGRVDFLEAAASDRGASSDRFSNFAEWRERITAADLRQRLARSRIEVGEVEDLKPVEYGPSSRVLEMEVVGREGHARLRGSQVRSVLGLKESLFVVDPERDEQGRVVAFVFTGRGWGHGVGMCQTGAYGLAREGYSYTAILQKYYTGIKVQRIY